MTSQNAISGESQRTKGAQSEPVHQDGNNLTNWRSFAEMGILLPPLPIISKLRQPLWDLYISSPAESSRWGRTRHCIFFLFYVQRFRCFVLFCFVLLCSCKSTLSLTTPPSRVVRKGHALFFSSFVTYKVGVNKSSNFIKPENTPSVPRPRAPRNRTKDEP